MLNQPIILTFVGCYLPGYKGGGPIRTVSNMTDRLGDAYDFRIVTADHDHGDKSPYEGVRPNQWSRVGNAEVYYASREHQTLPGFAGLMRHVPHDVLCAACCTRFIERHLCFAGSLFQDQPTDLMRW